ncbi:MULTISPECIES: hypothetical protein [Streptomyces]|uniref:hypothetical protein n=1 Tax=Streptomyces TaxID=1883 RepID=UPI0004C653A8|nr:MULTISPECIES: hypothetical protein [Streptomyces]RPK90717.1 hypothetical protein EES46_12255 [Streptomyces sp. ADI98-10]
MFTHETPAHDHDRQRPAPVARTADRHDGRDPRTPGGLQSTLGNATVTRLITVSRMVTEEEFRQISKGSGMRSRSEISKVDQALRAFYALPDARQGARLLALKDIVTACRAYVAHKPGGGERVAGVERLRSEAEEAQSGLDAEAVFRGLLSEVDRMVAAKEDPEMDLRLPADEARRASQRMPGPAFTAVMDGFIEQLGALREDAALPEETRAVIGELMAVVDLVTVKQYPQGGMPGMKLTTRADEDPAFTFNVDTQARGGSSFMLGHVAHELTHVAAHQAFGSSPVMELVQSGATDAQVTALATERKNTLADLRQALDGDTEFSPFQQRMLVEKLGYGGQSGKLKNYADSFASAGKITPEQQARLIAWDVAAGTASGTLIEYDTVINQMLVYLHQWEIRRDHPFYVRLLAAARAAFDRRSQAREAAAQAAGSA